MPRWPWNPTASSPYIELIQMRADMNTALDSRVVIFPARSEVNDRIKEADLAQKEQRGTDMINALVAPRTANSTEA